jgi:hypothetical protein
VFRARRDNRSRPIRNLMLRSIENRDTATRFDSDELIQRMSFLANLLFGPKAHQNQL